MIQIIQATEKDAALVTALSRSTFYDSFIENNTEADMQLFLDTYFTVENIAKELARPSNYCFVAYEHDVPAGYVNLREGNTPSELEGKNVMEIGRIYVVQDRIGSGIGKRLMQLSISLASEKKKEVLWLGVWEHNPRAIAFYERWGFEKFGEHKFILGTDVQNDWLMKKEL